MIVSAGSLGSPLILERSGIGSKDILEKYGVKTIVDLPGVGDKYQGVSLPLYLHNSLQGTDRFAQIIRVSSHRSTQAKSQILWMVLCEAKKLNSNVRLLPPCGDTAFDSVCRMDGLVGK